MDKNMIHIDDLTRQVLSHREEEQRPGAWIAMRELLDKQLPVGRTIAFPWGKFFGTVAVALVVTTLSIGGYKLYLDKKEVQTNPIAGNTIHTGNTTGGHFNQPNSNGADNTVIAPATGTNHTASNPTSTVADPAGAGNQVSDNPGNTPNSNATSSSDASQANSHAPSNAVVPKNPTQPNTPGAGSKITPKPKTNNKPGGVVNADPAHKPDTKSGNANQGNQPDAGKPTAMGNSGKHGDNHEVVPNGAVPGNKKPQGRDIEKSQVPGYLVMKETIPQIELRQRYIYVPGAKAMRLHTDTINSGSTVREYLVRADRSPYDGIGPAPLVFAGTTNVVPAASLTSTEDGAGSLVSLANHKVSSKHFNLNSRSFNDLLRNAAFTFSQVQMYTGVAAGLSMSMGAQGQYGFHLGLTELFRFNEEWTVLAELRYDRRVGNNLALHDDYTRCYGLLSFTTGTTTTYTWSEDGTEHYFNIPAIQSVELPISLRYHFNRAFMLGGLNFSYSPSLNIEEVSRYYNTPVTGEYKVSSSYPVVTPPDYVPSSQQVFVPDFASRFGLGYQVGAGYEFTPALQLDLRLSQTFWDNAKTVGSQRVSKEFFKLPSFQLTLGYRFSQKH